jgi:fluoride exporter
VVELLKRTLFARDTHPELPLDPDAMTPGEYKWPLHFIPGLQITVFVGGCIGTLARYGITSWLPDKLTAIPYGTLLINLLGAFLLGALLESLARRGDNDGKQQLIRLGVGTGFMGAFTTYSTLAVEVGLLARHSHVELALVYAALSAVGGLVCCAAGIHLAESYHREKVQ